MSLCELYTDQSIPKLEKVSCKPVDPGLLVDGVDGMDLTTITDFYNITLHVPFQFPPCSKLVVSIGRWNGINLLENYKFISTASKHD